LEFKVSKFRAAEVDQKAMVAGKQADDAQTLASNATQAPILGPTPSSI
jgi:hypothetical protein